MCVFYSPLRNGCCVLHFSCVFWKKLCVFVLLFNLFPELGRSPFPKLNSFRPRCMSAYMFPKNVPGPWRARKTQDYPPAAPFTHFLDVCGPWRARENQIFSACGAIHTFLYASGPWRARANQIFSACGAIHTCFRRVRPLARPRNQICSACGALNIIFLGLFGPCRARKIIFLSPGAQYWCNIVLPYTIEKCVCKKGVT